MRTIIVDDEKPILKLTKHYLKANPNIDIVGEANCVEDAVKIINLKKPELLLLDIELRKRLSFEILTQLDYNTYKVIFISAFEHYAIQAIKFSAYDFLVKPLNKEALLKTIDNLSKENKQKNIEARIKILEASLQQDKPKRIVLKTAEKYIIINIDDIIRLQADNTYTVFYLLENKKVLVSLPIKHYEELLPNNQFSRTHRSHIINIQHIKEYIKTDGGYIKMCNGDSVPLIDNKKPKVFQLLES